MCCTQNKSLSLERSLVFSFAVFLTFLRAVCVFVCVCVCACVVVRGCHLMWQGMRPSFMYSLWNPTHSGDVQKVCLKLLLGIPDLRLHAAAAGHGLGHSLQGVLHLQLQSGHLEISRPHLNTHPPLHPRSSLTTPLSGHNPVNLPSRSDSSLLSTILWASADPALVSLHLFILTAVSLNQGFPHFQLKGLTR